MNLKHNERGSALLMVLMIVVIFTVLGLGLLSMNISASKQFSMKEEQVQARHLAEMGILHYKAEIDKAVKNYNAKDFVYVMKTINGVTEIDMDASLRKYYRELCQAAESTSIIPHTSTNGEYTVTKGMINCNPPANIPNEMVFDVKSIGVVDSVSKIIDAQVTVASTNETVKKENVTGEIPKKPPYPEENWNSKFTIYDLDTIRSSPSKVEHGVTKKNPFVAQGFVELIGSLNINMKSDWTFKDHLLVSGSATMNTAGSNLSSITVDSDFYIGGAFHTNNHNKVNVGGTYLSWATWTSVLIRR